MGTLRREGGAGRLSRLFAAPSGPAPSFETVRWELIGGQGTAGSWGRSDRQNRARALTSFRGALYAGIGAAQAEVWRLADGSWERVGGSGVFGSWPARDPADSGGVGLRPGAVWVNALLPDPTGAWLYAGVKDGQRGAQLWRFDGGGWQQAGGLGGPGDWVSEDHDHVYSLCWHGGDLYVGLQGHFSGFKADRRESRDAVERLDPAPAVHGDGAVHRLAGETWSRVAGNGIAGSWEPDHAVVWVYDLCSLGGALYAAVGRHAVRGMRWLGEVWRLAGGGWRRIGGQGVLGSWLLDSSNLVTSLIDYQGKLLVGYNCQGRSPTRERFGNVWAWDSEEESWHDLELPATAPDAEVFAAQSSFNASTIWDGHLIVTGGRAEPVGDAACWALDVAESRWRCIRRPSRKDPDAPEALDGYGYTATVFDRDLVVGCRGEDGTAHIWRGRRVDAGG